MPVTSSTPAPRTPSAPQTTAPASGAGRVASAASFTKLVTDFDGLRFIWQNHKGRLFVMVEQGQTRLAVKDAPQGTTRYALPVNGKAYRMLLVDGALKVELIR